MDIKNYLHLYLGCGVSTEFGIATLVHIGILGSRSQIARTILPGMSTTDPWFDSNKLILRPLSDMTEEEAKCFYSFGGSHSIVNPKYAINQIFGSNLFYEGYNRIQIAQLMHYLLSKGFDLFGLIEAGLAIRKEL